ncbi:stage II sporulation protein D [Cohnella suwonensis]|uniref:Stage II sporulation protein D n=1 Tax=Cohnella suwonensis TaxID=696072 RepID=A0ABW0LXP4_9BACL
MRAKAKFTDGGGAAWIAFVAGILLSGMLWTAFHREEEGRGTPSVTVIPYLSDGQATENAKTIPTVNDPKSRTNPESNSGASEGESDEATVNVYLTKTGEIESVPLETYVLGVVAAEMPLDFEPAALEAQALAARTYIERRLALGDRSGVPAEGADVTDTVAHQVYRSLSDMKRLRAEDVDGYRKAASAVERTKGRIIVYGGQPIEALFFSTSNGYTENSEEVFAARQPYLRSVPSPWDAAESPRAKETIEIGLADFYRKLGIGALPVVGKAGLSAKKPVRVLERTPGRRVKTLQAGSERLTGGEARERLGLRSASFDLEIEGNAVYVTTYGSGHGVGMSQWGAEGLAKLGKTSSFIVEYYYKGARVEEVSKLANSPEESRRNR